MSTNSGHPLGARLMRALSGANRAVSLASRLVSDTTGLSVHQLLALDELAQRGPMTAGTLAVALGVSAATITNHADRLAERGLISRRRDSDDRRKVALLVTIAGRDLLSKAPALIEGRLNQGLGRLSAEERLAVVDTIEAAGRLSSTLTPPKHDNEA